uniref:VPS10 domain-containing protein n=1 Tax=Arcella intermedia TaxID=1963864 RepID=A0A6B2KYI2_9EUKA
MEESSVVDDYQIYFVSNNNQIVFIRTLDGSIFRSVDEGKTWTKQTVPQIMANIHQVPGGIFQLFNTQVKDGMIALYFLGADHKSLWVSSDGGETYLFWDTMPNNIQQLLMHPMYPGKVLGILSLSILILLLLSAKRRNGDKVEIWLGTQFGKEWTNIARLLPPSTNAFWSIFPHTSPNRIYLLQYSNPLQPDPRDTVLVYSDDYFTNTTVLPVRKVQSWAIYEPNKFVVISCVDPLCDSKQLLISDDGGDTFNLVRFPEYGGEAQDEHDFYIWEISDEAIWTYVERSCSRSNINCWGDIFHSNAADKDFTLSLPFSKKYEFTKFNSVDGIYLANQYTTRNGLLESVESVRSLITFNKGSDWEILRAPEVDASGELTNCSIASGCSLHVHGWGSGHFFSYFYSVPNAVGLMVASGNLGQKLDNRPDKSNTYISFNGGIKWQEVRKGSYIPEIGDFGGIIVLGKDSGVIDELLYTVDDGKEWRVCKYGDNSLDITNIRVAPGWKSRRFLMYGQKYVNNSLQTVVAQLNFDEELPKQCTAEDFTTWSPKDEHGQCVLGKATYYQKRKSLCYFGENYVQQATTENCLCVQEDYECDHCFYRKELGSPCTLECSVQDFPEPPANCSGYYEVDAGYRLVDNDNCILDGPHTPKPKGLVSCGMVPPKPVPQSNNSGYSILYVSIVILVLLVVIVIAIGLFRTNECFQHFVYYAIGSESDRSTNVTENHLVDLEQNSIDLTDEDTQ